MSALIRPWERSGRGAALVAMALLLLTTTVSTVSGQQPEPQSGTVSGRVTNGTPSGSVPDDLVVTLELLSGAEEITAYTATLAADASFHFENVPFDAGQAVVARTSYQGVTYVSESVEPVEGEREIILPLTIYDPTQDAAEIGIGQLHVFVSQVEDSVRIGEYAVLRNRGNRAYVGHDVGTDDGLVRTTWSAKLPQHAENLQFDVGELGGRFVRLEDGFADSRPIPPGGQSMDAAFSYELPFQEGLRVEQQMDIPIDAVVMVVLGETLELSGSMLSREGTVDTQMGTAVSYMTGPLDGGKPLVFRITGRKEAPVSQMAGDSSRELMAGLAALLAAAVAVGAMWRRPSPGPMPSEVRQEIKALAALEEDYERGDVAPEAYRERRRSLKQQVHDKLSS